LNTSIFWSRQARDKHKKKLRRNGVFAGVPMHANEFLLTDVLRNRFGLGEGGYIGRWVMMRETTRLNYQLTDSPDKTVS